MQMKLYRKDTLNVNSNCSMLTHSRISVTKYLKVDNLKQSFSGKILFNG